MSIGASSPRLHVHVSTQTSTCARFVLQHAHSHIHASMVLPLGHAHSLFSDRSPPCGAYDFSGAPPCLVWTTALVIILLRRIRRSPSNYCSNGLPSNPFNAATARYNARLASALEGPLCALILTPWPIPTHTNTQRTLPTNPIQASSSTLQKWWLERSTRPPTRPRTLPWRGTASFTSMAARRTPPCPPSLIWPWVPATTKRVSYSAPPSTCPYLGGEGGGGR